MKRGNRFKSVLRQLQREPLLLFETCRVCGKRFRMVTPIHLRTHGLSVSQYKERTGATHLECPEMRFRLALRMTRTSEEDVIREIRRRLGTGAPLSYLDVLRGDPRLFEAAKHIFGRWSAALRAAGLNPKEHSRRRETHWTPARVVKALRNLQERGRLGSSTRMRRENRALVGAAERHWGGWRRALAAAGLRARYRFRSKTEVVRETLRRELNGLPLNPTAVRREDSRLYSAALHHYRSWSGALRAAGITPAKHFLNVRWTPERVLRGICERRLNSLSMDYAAVRRENPALARAAVRLFTRWAYVMGWCGSPTELAQERALPNGG